MLAGDLPVDEYLRPLDLEYPAFSRDMCRLLQRLHGEGKKIFQVEPFLETLIGIHDFFAEGHGPHEITEDTLQHTVYLAEKKCHGRPSPLLSDRYERPL
jgi:hypothetical protein